MKVKQLWKVHHNAPIIGIELADINSNGQIEIIAYTKTGVLLFHNFNGKLLHKEIISKDLSLWHLKIYDIDNDGQDELIIGGLDGIIRAFKCNSTYELELLWIHTFNSSISGILINDINKDGKEELIIFSLDKTIRVLNPINGTLVWGQIFEDGVSDARVFLSDKNFTKMELLACSNDGTIRIFDGTDGKLLWFKHFSNKMRTITFLNTHKGPLIVCGGDDKKLHFINKTTTDEIRTLEFDNFIWKSLCYPFPHFNKILVSSYSFEYFGEQKLIEDIEFTSKLVCLNEDIDILWELKGYNIEYLNVIEIDGRLLVLFGTTKGKLVIVDEQTGTLLSKIDYDSCLNMIQLQTDFGLLISCYDDGTIMAYDLEKDIL